jgi:hypothetical protein
VPSEGWKSFVRRLLEKYGRKTGQSHVEDQEKERPLT